MLTGTVNSLKEGSTLGHVGKYWVRFVLVLENPQADPPKYPNAMQLGIHADKNRSETICLGMFGFSCSNTET